MAEQSSFVAWVDHVIILTFVVSLVVSWHLAYPVCWQILVWVHRSYFYPLQSYKALVGHPRFFLCLMNRQQILDPVYRWNSVSKGDESYLDRLRPRCRILHSWMWLFQHWSRQLEWLWQVGLVSIYIIQLFCRTHLIPTSRFSSPYRQTISIWRRIFPFCSTSISLRGRVNTKSLSSLWRAIQARL